MVDEDNTEASRRFIQALEKAPELKVEQKSRTEAITLVRTGKKVAYVILPAGFEASRDSIFQAGGLHLEAGLDPARKAESGMLQGILTRHAFSVLQGLFQDRTAMREQVRKSLDTFRSSTEIPALTRAVLERFYSALDTFLDEMPAEGEGEAEGEEKSGTIMRNWQPIRIDFTSVQEKKTGPGTSFDITMPQAFVWVFLGCAAAFGISLVTERTRGTLLRLRSAPITLGHILAGKALACFLTIVLDLIALYLFFHLVFGVRPDSYPLLALAFLCATIAFVGIMMLISVCGKTEASAGGVGWAFLLVMAMLGGGMVPLFFMPSWMQAFSNFSFVKWSVLAVEGAVWRGFSLTEMLLPCAILLGIGVVTFAAGVAIFRRTAE